MRIAVASRFEEGAATVLVLVTAAIVMFIGVALAGAASIVLTQRRAQGAADLAALAGAGAVASGHDGCAAAEQLAQANDAALEQCQLSGHEVRVAVSVVGPRLGDRSYDITAWSRAGPAGSSG